MAIPKSSVSDIISPSRQAHARRVRPRSDPPLFRQSQVWKMTPTKSCPTPVNGFQTQDPSSAGLQVRRGPRRRSQHEVDDERVVEVKRIRTAATLSPPTQLRARCLRSAVRDHWICCWPPTRWWPPSGRRQPARAAHRCLRKGRASRSARVESGLRVRLDPPADRQVHRPHL